MAASTLEVGGLVYNNTNTLKATAVTVIADYTGTSLKSSGYGSSVVTITAARNKPLNIQGNAKANKITGTSADDTFNGAAGNDTLTGNGGKNIFSYDSGNDVVTDYTAGDDTIKIAGEVSSYSFSGSDVTFKVGSGSLKVKGGKSSAITVVDSKNKTYTYDGGLIYDNTAAKAKALTVTAFYGSTLTSYGASVVTIDSSARTKPLNITGNAKNNFIVGTGGNDTIDGGEGNDTLTGGKGKDFFIYESGNDVIADYTAGQDTIKVTGEISDYEISGSDATFKIGSNTLKVKGGKSRAILIVDENKNASVYESGAIYNNAKPSKATAATLTSAYANSFTAGTSAISVDASPRKKAIKITGNAKDNFIVGTGGNDTIYGGKGDDTLSGGKGGDTLTGGAGADVFLYADGDGSDVITDYTSGEDLLRLTSGEIKSYSVKNGDAIFKVGSGAITLKGAGNTAVLVLDTNDVFTLYHGGLIYNGSQISRADVVTVTADYEGEFDSYGASVETIDASDRTKALNITGNGADNFILGGKGGDTISGGKGADTLNGGKGNDLLTGGIGDDVFYFSGEGSDTITDYSDGDIISVGGEVSYSVKNSDAVLKVGTGSVTLQDAAETAITIVGADEIASVYSGEEVATETWTSEVSNGKKIYGTDGEDIFVYDGGFSIIMDYAQGADKISIGAGSVGGGMVVDSDIFFAINGGVLKVLDAKDKTVTFLTDAGDKEYFNGKFLGEKVELTAGNDTYSNAISNVRIYALAGNDEISNETGTSGVTLDAGTGRDTIRNYSDGGTVYRLNAGDGATTVLGYNENDTIYVSAESYATQISGENFVVKAGSDSIFLRHAANFPVLVADFTGVQIYNSGGSRVVNGDNLSTEIVNTNSRATISGSADYNLINNYGSSVQLNGGDGVDYITNYGTGVTIDAGANDDYIWNYGDSATIDAGRGNDKIFLNSTGGSVLQYATGGGNDVVYNFSELDTLQISGDYSTLDSGEDLVVSVGSGSITFRNYSGSLNIRSGNGNLPADIFEDDNFTSGGIDELLTTGDLQIETNLRSAIEPDIFATEISYGTDEK